MTTPSSSDCGPTLEQAHARRHLAVSDERADRARLAYHLLRPTRALDEDRPLLLAAWECWRRATVSRELGRAVACSDDFLRQHEIGALFCGDECVGVSGLRCLDISLPPVRDDSCFQLWPASVLDELAASSPNVCVGSNLVVAPRWRGRRIGDLRASELLLTFAILRFRRCDADVMLGTMRTDRRLNEVAYWLGARPLLRGTVAHGVPADLVKFDRISTAHVGVPIHAPIRYERRKLDPPDRDVCVPC